VHGCSNRRMDSKEGSKRNNCTALEIVLALSLHSIPLLVVGCIGRRKIPPHHHSRHISRVRDQVEERCWSWTPKYVRLTHIVPCPASSPVCIHEVLDLQLSLLPFLSLPHAIQGFTQQIRASLRGAPSPPPSMNQLQPYKQIRVTQL